MELSKDKLLKCKPHLSRSAKAWHHGACLPAPIPKERPPAVAVNSMTNYICPTISPSSSPPFSMCAIQSLNLSSLSSLSLSSVCDIQSFNLHLSLSLSSVCAIQSFNLSSLSSLSLSLQCVPCNLSIFHLSPQYFNLSSLFSMCAIQYFNLSSLFSMCAF